MDNNQLTHDHHQHKNVDHQIVLLCDHVKGPANIGAIFRLADAFQVSEIIFCGTSVDITSNRLKRTARNTQSLVRFHESESILKTLDQLHAESFTSVALEITTKSTPIQDFKNKDLKNMVLIIGDENHGVSDAVLDTVHHTLHIPMYGANSSMNVAQATAIALYALRAS
ncbi:TrmH family RNA methyltransferase [Dokdonia ponticola]|uniref:TrmH family RNA methyltransferase n=1 Tax=Dokdonia ponticola TaxID=2041041 RepID=A0ABV9I2S0_9FLAO